MTVEIHAKLITLLAEVDELKSEEVRSNLKSSATWSKSRNPRVKLAAAMMNSANISVRTRLRLKREMDNLRDELFAREQEEAIIVDEAHVVTGSTTYHRNRH